MVRFKTPMAVTYNWDSLDGSIPVTRPNLLFPITINLPKISELKNQVPK